MWERSAELAAQLQAQAATQSTPSRQAAHTRHNMAHFAELVNGIVARVIVVDNADTALNGVEDGAIGAAFCAALLGGTWVQTSYNGNMRFNYAGIGYSYDAGRDAFIAPQPFASWLLDETTCRWAAPVPMPAEGGPWQWDEATLSWVAA